MAVTGARRGRWFLFAAVLLLAAYRALVVWGTAKITVMGCDSVKIVIDGSDGTKTSNTVRLAGIIGASCTP